MPRPASKLVPVVAAVAGLLLSSALAAAARAQGAQQPPAPAAPKDFRLPATRDFTLPNGMQVTLAQYGRLPLATVVLVERTGAIDEGPTQVWTSKLLGDYLQQGTTTRSAAAVAQAVAGMGGRLQVSAGADETTLSGSVLGDSTTAFVTLIGDVIRHPSFPDSQFARLRTDRVRNLAIEQAEPQSIAGVRYAAQIYPDHPYGRLVPTEQALASYTADQVRDFYRRQVGAARTHLYVVGQFSADAVEQAVRTAFGDWAAGAPPTVNVPTPRAERMVALIDRPGAVQSTIDLGLPVPDPTSADWIAFDVTDALLGGSFGSRITSNIREQKGYTYSPFSFVDANYRAARWTETADVTTNVTGASLKEIFGEIDRLRSEAPATDELRGIQNYLAGLYVLRSSTQRGLARQFEFVNLHGLGDAYLSSYVRRVYAVTPADVQRIAQQYLDPGKMAIVVAGDRKTVADQLAPYGKVVQ
jgi:zinc protease